MMDELIEQMAVAARNALPSDSESPYVSTRAESGRLIVDADPADAYMARFAVLVAEKCAQACDAQAASQRGAMLESRAMGSEECAGLIRAMFLPRKEST
ncbi:MAG TPA: hypothetical protein VGH59_10230 [Casimicrobiaceae bacterium]|jgi:hypothetical protein